MLGYTTHKLEEDKRVKKNGWVDNEQKKGSQSCHAKGDLMLNVGDAHIGKHTYSLHLIYLIIIIIYIILIKFTQYCLKLNETNM